MSAAAINENSDAEESALLMRLVLICHLQNNKQLTIMWLNPFHETSAPGSKMAQKAVRDSKRVFIER